MTSLMRKLAGLVVAALMATTTLAAAARSEIQTGDQSRWSLAFRMCLEQNAGPPVEVRLTGNLVSTVVATRSAEYDAQLQVDHVSFTGDAVKSAAAVSLEELRLRLSRRFWATYRSDGGLLAIHFYSDVSPSDRNLLQMIATELQLVRPDSARPSWTAQERDGAGEYVALYAMPQPHHVIKRKLKYVYTDGVADGPAESVHVAIEQSSVTFLLSSDGRVQAADGTSRMRMELSLDRSGELVAVTEIHVVNLRSTRAPELIGSLARALPSVTSSSIVTHRLDPAEAQALADDRLIEGHTIESLLTAAFAKDTDDSSLPGRLIALFRRRPDAASAAVALLTKNGAQRRLTNALGSAGSLAAIAALRRLSDDSTLPDDLRADAVIAFVQMQNPTAEVMRIPYELISDSSPLIRSAARMISGALARAGRSAYPTEAGAIDASLSALYRNASEAPQRIELLGALGNSAGPSVVPIIEEALRDPLVPIRAAATRALRLAPGSEVDRLLANVITSDHDASVRASAIFAARFRRPLPTPLADALLLTARTDAIDYVRSDAVAVLRANPTASPSIRKTLALIAGSDTNAGIRRQASQALASLDPAAQR